MPLKRGRPRGRASPTLPSHALNRLIETAFVATHLLQSGYDIGTVQELRSHKDVSITMMCTHVWNRGGRGVRSPLDEEKTDRWPSIDVRRAWQENP